MSDGQTTRESVGSEGSEGEAMVQQDDEDGVHEMDSVYRDLNRVQLAPPDSYRIKVTDQLVVVAPDRLAADAGMRGISDVAFDRSGRSEISDVSGVSDVSGGLEAPPHASLPEPTALRRLAATRIQRQSRGKLAREKTKQMRREMSSMATRAVAVLTHLPHSSHSSNDTRLPHSRRSSDDQPGLPGKAKALHSKASRRPRPSKALGPESLCALTPKKVLLIGWSQSLGQLLRAFDVQLPHGSKLYILADREMSARQSDMEADGIALDGSAREARGVEHHKTDAGSDTDERMSDDDGTASATTSCGLRHIRIRHVVGFVTDYLALRRLPVRSADIAVIIVQSKVATPPRVAVPVGATRRGRRPPGPHTRRPCPSLPLCLSPFLSLSPLSPPSHPPPTPPLSHSSPLLSSLGLIGLAEPCVHAARGRRTTWAVWGRGPIGWRALSWPTRRR